MYETTDFAPEVGPYFPGDISRHPKDLGNIVEFCDWCSAYGLFWFGRNGTTNWQRLNIGLYQYAQSLEWIGVDDVSRSEALCSMILHVTSAAMLTHRDSSPAFYLPPTFSQIPKDSLRQIDESLLLRDMTNLMQCHYYWGGSLEVSKVRKNRASPDKISQHTASLVRNTMNVLPMRLFDRGMSIAVTMVLEASHTK